MDLDSFQNNLIKINVWQTLIPIINKNLHHIERLNREQLWRGDSSIDKIAVGKYKNSEKTEIYLEDKISRGAYDESIYPYVNLYDEGSFYKGIQARLTLFDIEIESLDSKADELEDKYGHEIYGLNSESLEKFIDIIIDEFRDNLLNEILK